MGFIVSQSITHSLYGEIPSFYSRIESYRLNKTGGELFLTVMSYYDKDAAEIVDKRDLSTVSIDCYPVAGEIEYNGNVFDMNNLLFHRVFVTSSYYEIEDIYEELPFSESVDYFEYDDNGNMFQTSSMELVYRFTKTGERYIERTQIDISPLTASFYQFSYDIVKREFGEVFGHENIIDV